MSDTAADKLRAADQAAAQQSATLGVDATVKGCPLARGPARARGVVAVRVVGEDGQPLAAVAVELRQSEAAVLHAATDRAGDARFDGLSPGGYELSLPELDREAWQVAAEEPLDNPAGAAEDAGWQAPPQETPSPGFTHTVAPGDCVSSLGARFGFFPGTIWDLPANAALRALRQHQNVIQPGDEVIIPARRRGRAAVTTGNRYRVRRLGVPSTLRIRFLDGDGEARASVPYLLHVETEDEARVPDRGGVTDAAGFLVEAIPPRAAAATVLLGKGDQQETHRFRLGHVDPLDTLDGARDRLTNLGYPCGDEEGDDLGPYTEAALLDFQGDHGLEPTGDYDEATRDLLASRHLS